ncbi:MAG: kynureninase [Clostridiales bacterium]|nr:kynureninase [Clostridiales bacterium]
MNFNDYDFIASEAFAEGLDEADDLNFSGRFHKIPGVIYMDGNSLGLMPKDAEDALLSAVEDYKRLGIDGWMGAKTPWFYYPESLGARMAGIVGGYDDEVAIAGSTTVNIHNMLATFYKPSGKRAKILMDELNFPSDIYAAQGHVRLHGLSEDHLVLVKSRDGSTLLEEDIISAFTEEVSVALLPAVLYRSGQLLDMERLTRKAHEKGVLIGFDCCHSAGSVPHRLHEWDVDFAVWCCYKYLNGGPGASSGLFVNRRHHGGIPGLPGWFSYNKDKQFDMSLEFEPAQNAGAWQIGTPNIFSMAPIEGSLKVFEEFGMDNVRRKSLHMTAYMMFLIDSLLAGEYGFSIATPREPERRGGHVGLAHPEEAVRINACLKKHGVVPDFRYPDIIRLAPVALYTTYHEIWKVVSAIKGIMDSKEYLLVDSKREVVA